MNTVTLDRSPSSSYVDPWQLVRSPDMDMESKRNVLAGWLQDELALLVAADDGMDAGHSSRIDELLLAMELVDANRN